MAGKMVLYKLVVLGDGGVGKTAMTIQLCLNHFVETYDPTIEDSYRKQVMIDGQSCMLEVLDTAGQEEYTALRDQWMRDGEAFLLVYSVSSRSSFSHIRKFHAQVQRVKERPASDSLHSSDTASICLLVGNKSDRDTQREVSTLEGHELADELGCYFVELSAKSHQNTEKAFYDVIRHLRRQRLEARGTLPERRLRTQETEGYTVRCRWWGWQVSIPAGEAKSEDGQKRLTRALVNAAKRNRERELIVYLEAGANINGQPGSDGAAIHAAAASGHAKIVNILVKKGAAINAKGPSGTSPLQIAAAEGHLPVVKLLLNRGAQINQTSQLHGTALSAAASRGRVAVVRFLLREKANVNVVGGPYGNALQAAAWIGSSAIVEALLGAGADINARGDGDCTALQIAAFAGHANVIRSLLNLGGTFNINAPGGKHGSALKAADDQGHFEAVTVLRKAGAIVIPKSPVNSESPDVPGDSEAEVAPMTDQTVESALETPRSPTEAAGSSSPKTNEAQNASLRDRNAKSAIITPMFSWDSLFSPNTPDLANTLSTDGISRPSVPFVGRLGERPTIHAVGFSSISDPIDANVDIVFVHGLQGHPEKTWSNGPAPVKRRFSRPSSVDLSIPVQKTIFWPYDLLSKHPDFVQTRILTWGYDSRVVSEFFGTSDQHNISQHGSDLMVALQQERKRNPFRPLIFVAHSLGGILVKVALDESKRATHQPQYLPIYDSTKAIIFLGTPHGGSGSTNWGLLASNLSKLALQGPSERILRGLRPNNEVLENLRKVFLQMLEDNKFKIHSFFETKPMLGVYGLNDRVVPYESARVGHARQEIVRAIDGNHSEICKFSSTADPGYKAVLGALEDYLLAIKENSN